MKIAAYLTTSLIEWPGKIVAVVFSPGCNFRCPFCYNTEFVIPQKVKRIKFVPELEILQDLKNRADWLDAVVFSGGEPLLQVDIESFLEKVKKIGLSIGIETNGSQPTIVKKFIKRNLVDFWAVDLKIDWQQYADLIGFPKPEKIQETIKAVVNSKKEFQVRTTLVPGIHHLDTLEKMARQLRALEGDRISWRWQNFQPGEVLDPAYSKKKPMKAKDIEKMKKIIQKKFGFEIKF